MKFKYIDAASLISKKYKTQNTERADTAEQTNAIRLYFRDG